MRVLNGRILVAIQVDTTDKLVKETNIRRGVVTISGSNQIKENEKILFGNDFEEIDINIEIKSSTRYYLMLEDNVKIIYDNGDTLKTKSNVLPFLKNAS